MLGAAVFELRPILTIFDLCDLEMTPKRSSKVKGQFTLLLIGTRRTFFVIHTHMLGAAVSELWPILTIFYLCDLEMTP